MAHKHDIFSGRFEFPGDEPVNETQPELLRRDPVRPEIITDAKGNQYDETGELIKEKPDPYFERALRMVRTQHPGEPEDYLKRLAQVEARILKKQDADAALAARRRAGRSTNQSSGVTVKDEKSAAANDREEE